jgi:hypothetical protein
MRKIALLFASLAAALVALLPAAPLHAAPKTFAASTGSGTTCSRALPCSDLSAAINAADTGGEVNCLDSGPFPPTVFISKSITVDCAGSIIVGSASTAIYISAGSSVVTLRHLTLNGNPGYDGLHVNSVGALFVENCAIENFAHAGIELDGSISQLIVSDTVLSNNGSSGITAGILAKVPVKLAIERTRVENNTFGIFADGTGGAIRGTVKDSFVSGNANNGISVNTTSAAVSLMIDNTLVSGNNYGLAVAGTNGLLLVRRSTITANSNGLASFSGGQIVSYRDNSVNNNTIDGAFSFTIGTQ